MKTKGFILSLFILCFVSCDITTPFVIDGRSEYVLSGECGTISVLGASLRSLVIVSCEFNGQYLINTDSLKIKADFNEGTITNVRFRLNKKEFTGKEIETKGGEELVFSFRFGSTGPLVNISPSEVKKLPKARIKILPSNFITCEGKPIITDTVTIQLK